MATIGELKSRISKYIQVPAAEFAEDGYDLLLGELNNARKAAERLRDWHCEERYLSVVVDPTTGGAWADATTLATGETVKLVKQYYILQNAVDVPLLHISKKMHANAKRRRFKAASWDYNTRFRGDYGNMTADRSPKIYVEAQTIYLDPTPSIDSTVNMDAFVWLADYSLDSDTDWFTDNGADYLVWASLVALNYMTGTYAPRQEGVVPPPERMRDEAFLALASLDNYLYEVGSVPFG